MWRPPEKIRHQLPAARWPTAEEAAAARLFSPLDAGRLQLAERSWVPAMVPWRATGEGEVTDAVLGWYERFAQGRPGAIVVEATGIRDVPSGPLLRAGHDRFVPGLRELADTVRRASGGRTRLFIQLIDFLGIRRRPPRERYLRQFLVLTDEHRRRLEGGFDDDESLRECLLGLDDEALAGVLSPRELEALTHGHRERVTDVHLPHVAELPQRLPSLFAEAAARAEEAGFDGIELHYAHAYTMASFLSATNDRTDGYGGTIDDRLRLPLEVFDAVRERVGCVVGCRFLAEECIEGGSGLDDAVVIGRAFAEAGMDFLSLSRGGKFDDAAQPKVGQAVYPYTGRSGYECMPTVHSDEHGPFGRNLAAVRRIRNALRTAGHETPVVACGGIASFDQAEGALQDGTADIAAAARQSLADPDWFAKMRSGRGDEVRRCCFTNYCEALDQKHVPVTCQLWDRVELDAPDVPLTPDGRRRLTAPPWLEGRNAST
ncbi:MAG: NADH:flavin oxidoreductase [Acidobacteriota bacterium]